MHRASGGRSFEMVKRSPAGEKSMPTHFHAIVWIDHSQAKVFHIGLSGDDEVVLHPHMPTRHLHHKANSIGSGHAGFDKEFLAQVMNAVSDAGEILIIGPGRREDGTREIYPRKAFEHRRSHRRGRDRRSPHRPRNRGLRQAVFQNRASEGNPCNRILLASIALADPGFSGDVVVGAAGFEPTTCSTQNCRATRLRYTPIIWERSSIHA